MRASTFIETLWQDLRFGARTLGRNPGFAVIAVVTLALGIGANAAIFSVVNAVLLRPLPWSEPDRAVMIWSKWVSFDKTWVATGEVVDYRRRAQTLAEVAAWSEGQVNLTGSDAEPERVDAATVTANTFSTLGASPMLGRTFTAKEDVPNGPNVAVIGFGLWHRRFASDPSIVGKSILINGRAIRGRRRDAAAISSCRPISRTPNRARSGRPSSSIPRAWITAIMGSTPPVGSSLVQPFDKLPRNCTAIAQAMTKRGTLPRPDAVRHRGPVAHRRGRRQRAPRDMAAVRRGRLSAAHRLRQRREPAARARRSASAGDRSPVRARRRPAAGASAN